MHMHSMTPQCSASKGMFKFTFMYGLESFICQGKIKGVQANLLATDTHRFSQNQVILLIREFTHTKHSKDSKENASQDF